MTGQKALSGSGLSGHHSNLSGHDPMTGPYFDPCILYILSRMVHSFFKCFYFWKIFTPFFFILQEFFDENCLFFDLICSLTAFLTLLMKYFQIQLILPFFVVFLVYFAINFLRKLSLCLWFTG